jgi:3-oxoacyl-[acyl-carrier protein] reductase
MTDMLLELGRRPLYRKAVRTLGLPVPMPQTLRRADGPWTDAPLEGRTVDLVGAAHGTLGAPLEGWLEAAGARIVPEAKDAIVLDATGLSKLGDLRQLYDRLHPRIGAIAPCGRVLIVARAPEEAASAEVAAVLQALDGFMRSVAKEIGRRGATANLLLVDADAEDRAAALLEFLLSPRSAFITGQRWHARAMAAAPSDAPPRARSLDGRVAVVTGAARGIGAETARVLAAEGAHVVCVDRPEDEDDARNLAVSIGGSAFGLDVAGDDAPERLASHLSDAHGGVDVVVHNAGITRDRTLAKMSAPQWDQAVAVNLEAPLRLSQALLERPEGGLRDGGRIVCLSSVAGIAGNVGQTNYAASKAGLVGWVRALAPQVAGRGITVNAVAPGFIETRLTAAIPVMQREAARRLSALGQGGIPRDVAEAIGFLCLPRASGLTGEVVRVCGGMFIGA